MADVAEECNGRDNCLLITAITSTMTGHRTGVDPFLPVNPTPGHGQVSNADLPFEIPTEPYRQPSPGATWVKMDSITCAQYATPN